MRYLEGLCNQLGQVISRVQSKPVRAKFLAPPATFMPHELREFAKMGALQGTALVSILKNLAMALAVHLETSLTEGCNV